MDATIGFITLNCVNKNLDMLIAYLAIAAGLLLMIAFYRGKPQRLSFSHANLGSEREIIPFAVLCMAFFVILSQAGKTDSLLYVGSFSLAFITLKNFIPSNEKYLKFLVYIVIPYILIVTKVFASTSYFFANIALLVIFTIFLWRCKSEAFAVAVIVFCSKIFYSGPLEVVDAFHTAEHFLASMEAYKGLFGVFPNLGYLEEYPAFAVVKIFKLLSGGIVQMSIATARSLLWVTLVLMIFSQFYQRHRFLTVLFLIALPTDRISLLIALAYASFISARYERTYSSGQWIGGTTVALLALFPLLAIGLSPSYLLIPILGLVGIFPFTKFHRKQIIAIVIAWAAISAIFYQPIVNYIIIYKDFSRLFDIAFSKPSSNLSTFTLAAWVLLLIGVSAVVTGIFKDGEDNRIKVLKVLGAILVLMQYANYGFGRIDPGFSRLATMAIPLMLVASFFSKRFNGLVAVLIGALIVSYIQFSPPQKLSFSSFTIRNPRQQAVQLSPANAKLAARISEFAAGRGVINYSNEPALTLGITNALATPFTTPFVTIGEKSQNAVIQFIEKNSESIVYLGHDFNTFDGIDVRLRVPLVFRYLARKFVYVSAEGNIYAVPKTDSKNEGLSQIFFDQLDIKKSSLYYTNNAPGRFIYREVTVNCPMQVMGRYRIINEHNTLLGDLQCGVNYVPEVFFLGAIKMIENE